MSETAGYGASVVVVCDYASGSDQALSDVRRALTAVAAQDFDEPIEYILVESEELRDRLPQDVLDVLPSLRVVFSPAHGSCELRNDGVRAASCEIVATLDADCTPDPGWLRHLVEDLRNHPEAAAVSSSTRYNGEDLLSRVAGAIERSYITGESLGPTVHLAPSAAGFRRSVYLEHCLPIHVGPFAGRLQSESMLRAGRLLLFDPRLRVRHQFYPGFYATYHYNVGYATVRVRLEDARLRDAWLARLGFLSLPIFFGGRLLKGWMRALRWWPDYGIRWYEVPSIFAIAICGCLLEIPGMVRALRGEPPPATLFR